MFVILLRSHFYFKLARWVLLSSVLSTVLKAENKPADRRQKPVVHAQTCNFIPRQTHHIRLLIS